MDKRKAQNGLLWSGEEGLHSRQCLCNALHIRLCSRLLFVSHPFSSHVARLIDSDVEARFLQECSQKKSKT